jgi:cyclic pyranopterin phosphate synthase
MTNSYRLYSFEGIDTSLTLIPLCARRTLDALGAKLSLAAWQSLPLSARDAIAAAGSGKEVATEEAIRALSLVDPAPQAVQKENGPPSEVVPDDVTAALGQEHPLADAVWSALEPLDRWVLVKVARRGNPERVEQAYAEIVGHSADSVHLRPDGSLRMVNVADKSITERTATAESRVTMSGDAFARLQRGDSPKGDVLSTARLAGIMAAKRTSDLIPLCHPLRLSSVEVDCALMPESNSVVIEAKVIASDRTGVEMEALLAASIAALTIYDMLKAFDRSMVIGSTRLLAKSGGRSGDFFA